MGAAVDRSVSELEPRAELRSWRVGTERIFQARLSPVEVTSETGGQEQKARVNAHQSLTLCRSFPHPPVKSTLECLFCFIYLVVT